VTTSAGARVYDPRLSPLRQAVLAAERRYKERRHYILQSSAERAAELNRRKKDDFTCQHF